ncbi:hypothetical protein ACFWPK_04255 [Nocardia sp. NPDC058519]|uniref:hypothetical protein n=1 Tax=Nocardia sp. NPDC058519 TaxID=3346535 RepID=UPI00365E8373
MGEHSLPEAPTQVQYPWRAALRTAVQVVLGLLVAAPVIVEASGLPETAAGVGVALTVSATVTRLMSIPAVDAAIDRWLPWLAAAGTPTRE